MISLRKRYANWLNARASTGPRTAAGKARVAQNARKHGLRVPALRDPAMAKSIGELARKLAGPTADARRFEAACQLVAAQIDLLRIRQARLPLLSRVTEGRTAVRNLTTLDLYERYARSRRKSAMRQFNNVSGCLYWKGGICFASPSSVACLDSRRFVLLTACSSGRSETAEMIARRLACDGYPIFACSPEQSDFLAHGLSASWRNVTGLSAAVIFMSSMELSLNLGDGRGQAAAA